MGGPILTSYHGHGLIWNVRRLGVPYHRSNLGCNMRCAVDVAHYPFGSSINAHAALLYLIVLCFVWNLYLLVHYPKNCAWMTRRWVSVKQCLNGPRTVETAYGFQWRAFAGVPLSTVQQLVGQTTTKFHRTSKSPVLYRRRWDSNPRITDLQSDSERLSAVTFMGSRSSKAGNTVSFGFESG